MFSGAASGPREENKAVIQNLITNFKQLDTLSQQKLLNVLLHSSKASSHSVNQAAASATNAKKSHELNKATSVPGTERESQMSSPEKQVNLQIIERQLGSHEAVISLNK